MAVDVFQKSFLNSPPSPVYLYLRTSSTTLRSSLRADSKSKHCHVGKLTFLIIVLHTQNLLRMSMLYGIQTQHNYLSGAVVLCDHLKNT